MIIRSLLFLAVAGAAAGAAYVRFAPMDATAWHVDPATVTRSGKPNDYLVSEGGDRAPVIVTGATPEAALAQLDAIATAEKGVTRLAGSPQDGHVTYVQRTPLMGYPDAISVTATAAGEDVALRLYSRSRFGHSDLGVNEARVERWLAAVGE
ncbi:DUF1499 domain-containing protein [Jannaschia marina]|uniref:DUF1499 domain-containing protein n=1 Tax=Jannaschia marina TaxID=2741674 RepID=UPI0015CB5873|nr:DUF1499 domain-containing protein [Jannaschia marina]